MSEPIRDAETAVRELGALPVPVGPEPQLTPERLAEIRDLVRYESSIEFYSHRAKESILLLLAEAQAAAELRTALERRTTLLREVQATARRRAAEAEGRKAYGDRLAAENAELRARLAEYERPAEDASFTEARAAFVQMGTTPSLEGLRAELRIEGKPPLVGRYVGAVMQRLHDVPGCEGLLAIDPRLVFAYGEGADA